MDSETAFATEVKCPSPPPLSSRLVNSAGTAEPERRRRRSRRRPSPRYENWSDPFTSGGLARGASRFGCSRSICFSACNNLSTLADASQGIGGSQQHQLTEPDYRLMNALFSAQQNFTVSGECLLTEVTTRKFQSFEKFSLLKRKIANVEIEHSCIFEQRHQVAIRKLQLLKHNQK